MSLQERIHFLVGYVGVSHFAELREKQPMTVWEMLINLKSNDFGAARWLSGRASDFRSKGRGFEPRPWRCCATTLGKLFTPHCLIHAILHEEDCGLFIKSKIKKAPIPQWWGKCKHDSESVSRTEVPQKLHRFFLLVDLILPTKQTKENINCTNYITSSNFVCDKNNKTIHN